MQISMIVLDRIRNDCKHHRSVDDEGTPVGLHVHNFYFQTLILYR